VARPSLIHHIVLCFFPFWVPCCNGLLPTCASQPHADSAVEVGDQQGCQGLSWATCRVDFLVVTPTEAGGAGDGVC